MKEPISTVGSQPRHGFTLIEALVATLLVGIVIGLALEGFNQVNKITSLTRSKALASDEAARGVAQIAKILRRSSIIFFSGRPLPGIDTRGGPLQPDTVAAMTHDQVEDITKPIPDVLFNNGVVTDPLVYVNYAFSNGSPDTTPSTQAMSAAMAAIDRRLFRFASKAAGGLDRTNDRQRLAPAPGSVQPPSLEDMDNFFPSPLLYCAEAIFNTGGSAGGNKEDVGIPMTWNVYVVYLAPMSFANAGIGDALLTDPGAVRGTGDALLPDPAAARDRGPGGWKRSTIPFELRLLTIPDMEALCIDFQGRPLTNNAGPAPAYVVAPPGAAANALQPWFRWGRRMDQTGILPAPFDVANTEIINYDPIPLPMQNGGDSILYTTGGPILGEPSGARILDFLHPNWSNLGNDPPKAVRGLLGLQSRRLWTGTAMLGTGAHPIIDSLLASYVDPDSVHGTCVRLANIFGLPAPGIGTPAIAANESPNRPYVNAYEGPQRWRSGVPFPRRAFVSVTTRYRTSRHIPFQFATNSVEVDLEALVRYQQQDRFSR